MAFGVKTNERPGTRAQARYVRTSAYKAREVLDLIRGEPCGRALEILQFSERDIARVIQKVVESAMANAEHNDQIPQDELYVSACYADEGPTLKRWRPRARGRRPPPGATARGVADAERGAGERRRAVRVARLAARAHDLVRGLRLGVRPSAARGRATRRLRAPRHPDAGSALLPGRVRAVHRRDAAISPLIASSSASGTQFGTAMPSTPWLIAVRTSCAASGPRLS